MNASFKFCVYGGQFGSEGKGCVAEWLIEQHHDLSKRLVVIGENGPNSGHTNSRGKTRSMPVSAWYADLVILGPDSAIDPGVFLAEVKVIRAARNGAPEICVHEAASIVTKQDIAIESKLVDKIGSTATGGGEARCLKAATRDWDCTARSFASEWAMEGVQVVDRRRYYELTSGVVDEHDCLFECSQGLMLDLNLGYFPYVTSRPTHPRVSIERNGLGPSSRWTLVGTFRPHPIRTGGRTGPTGAPEISWEKLGVTEEQASVTKRIRRVFQFSDMDFLQSVALVKPELIFFTHLDYLQPELRNEKGFKLWLKEKLSLTTSNHHPDLSHSMFFGSERASEFTRFGGLFA